MRSGGILGLAFGRAEDFSASDFLFDQPGDPDQDDRAEYRYQDGPEQAATTKADQANHPPANDSTNDSQAKGLRTKS